VSKANINSWRHNRNNRYGGLMADAFKEYMAIQGLEYATVFEKMLYLEHFKKFWNQSHDIKERLFSPAEMVNNNQQSKVECHQR
jgi:hypothetical protein